MEERIYLFHENRGNGDFSKSVKESELTESQKNLLLIDLAKKFAYLPREVQDKFVTHCLTEPKTNPCGINVKEGKFTPETVSTSEHYYTDENGHVRPKSEYNG